MTSLMAIHARCLLGFSLTVFVSVHLWFHLPPSHAQAQAKPQRVIKLTGFIQHLQWSPDGKKFLFTRSNFGGKMGLWTVNVDGSELTQLLPKAPGPCFDGHWSPDSKQIVFVYDILRGTDGQLQIDVMSADGSNQKNLVPHKTFFEESPRFARDGKKIAWTSTRNKNQDIWVMDADGKNAKALTTDLAIDNAPTWSPDGKQLAFTSARAGNLDIWLMNADGSNAKRLTDHPRMDYWPAWSPDGKHIAFTSNRDGNYEIYLMNPDGSGQRNFSQHPGLDNWATWSPDARRLAWISNRDGEYAIIVADVLK
jgi:TolB protein